MLKLKYCTDEHITKHMLSHSYLIEDPMIGTFNKNVKNANSLKEYCKIYYRSCSTMIEQRVSQYLGSIWIKDISGFWITERFIFLKLQIRCMSLAEILVPFKWQYSQRLLRQNFTQNVLDFCVDFK